MNILKFLSRRENGSATMTPNMLSSCNCTYQQCPPLLRCIVCDKLIHFHQSQCYKRFLKESPVIMHKTSGEPWCVPCYDIHCEQMNLLYPPQPECDLDETESMCSSEDSYNEFESDDDHHRHKRPRRCDDYGVTHGSNDDDDEDDQQVPRDFAFLSSDSDAD